MQRALRLVDTAAAHARDALEDAAQPDAPPARRLYARWLAMFDKAPHRCGFGPGRSRMLAAWLTVYDLGTLELAIDGAAADEWVRAQGAQFTSIEWILRNEASIERFVEAGVALHEAIERRAAAQALPKIGPAPHDPVLLSDALDRIKAVRDELRRRHGR